MNRWLILIPGLLALVANGCGPSSPASSSPASLSPASVSPTLAATASPSQAADLTITGDIGGSDLLFTTTAPARWNSIGFGGRSGAEYGDGAAFFVSVVYNTYTDPCQRVQRDPTIGDSVDHVVAALGDIPNTTATAPQPTTIAGHAATYIEVQIPASLGCHGTHFYLWQDSPDLNGTYWVLKPEELLRIWVIEEQGYVLALATRASPGTPADLIAEAQAALDSMVFTRA